MGHLGPDERGPGVQGADREVQRGRTRTSRSTTSRCRSARRRTSSRPPRRPGPGAPDILRAEVAWVPEFASLGYLYALDGSELLADETTTSRRRCRRTSSTARRTACRRSPTRSPCCTTRRSSPTPASPRPPKTWAEVKTAAARRSRPRPAWTASSSTPVATSCCRSSTARAATWSTPDAKKIVVNSAENVAGIQVAQDLVNSGAAVKPPANDSYGTMMTLFKESKVAMIINGPWEVNNVTRRPDVRRPREPRHRRRSRPAAPRPVRRSAATTTSSAPAWRRTRPRRDRVREVHELGRVAGVPGRRSSACCRPASRRTTCVRVKTTRSSRPSSRSSTPRSARPWIPEGGQFFGPLDTMATEVLVQGKDVQGVPRRGGQEVQG